MESIFKRIESVYLSFGNWLSGRRLRLFNLISLAAWCFVWPLLTALHEEFYPNLMTATMGIFLALPLLAFLPEFVDREWPGVAVFALTVSLALIGAGTILITVVAADQSTLLATAAAIAVGGIFFCFYSSLMNWFHPKRVANEAAADRS